MAKRAALGLELRTTGTDAIRLASSSTRLNTERSG